MNSLEKSDLVWIVLIRVVVGIISGRVVPGRSVTGGINRSSVESRLHGETMEHCCK